MSAGMDSDKAPTVKQCLNLSVKRGTLEAIPIQKRRQNPRSGRYAKQRAAHDDLLFDRWHRHTIAGSNRIGYGIL
jgi:hypothetical protein